MKDRWCPGEDSQVFLYFLRPGRKRNSKMLSSFFVDYCITWRRKWPFLFVYNKINPPGRETRYRNSEVLNWSYLSPWLVTHTQRKRVQSSRLFCSQLEVDPCFFSRVLPQSDRKYALLEFELSSPLLDNNYAPQIQLCPPNTIMPPKHR